MKRNIAVEWRGKGPQGGVQILAGSLVGLAATRGECRITHDEFAFASRGSCRLEISVGQAKVSPGSGPTIVSLRTQEHPLSFFLKDVCREYPIIIPEYGVAVTEAEDRRSYDEIEKVVLGKGLQTALQRFETEPEESYEQAAAHTRELHCPTWLGLSRDFRIFEMGWDTCNEKGRPASR